MLCFLLGELVRDRNNCLLCKSIYVKLGIGLTAMFMVHLIRHSNEMGENTFTVRVKK